MWEKKRFCVRSVPRFDFVKYERNAERPSALIFGPWKSPLRRRRARSKGRVGPLTRLFFFAKQELSALPRASCLPCMASPDLRGPACPSRSAPATEMQSGRRPADFRYHQPANACGDQCEGERIASYLLRQKLCHILPRFVVIDRQQIADHGRRGKLITKLREAVA